MQCNSSVDAQGQLRKQRLKGSNVGGRSREWSSGTYGAQRRRHCEDVSYVKEWRVRCDMLERG